MLQQAGSAEPIRYDAAFGGSDQHASEDLSPPVLLNLWQAVLRWRWVILGIIAVAMTVGVVATLLTTPKYTAATRIEISREQKKVTNVEGLDSADVGRDLEFYQTQYSLLEATSLAQRVGRVLRLADDPAFFAAHKVKPRVTGTPTDAAQRATLDNQVTALLLTHVTIDPIRNSSLVDIKYTSISPEMSARIANMWVTQFVAANMDRRFASTAEARSFLEGRLATLRERLERSERDLVNYAAAKHIVSLAEVRGDNGQTQVQRTLASSDLEALNAALLKATADRVEAESRAKDQGGVGDNVDALTSMAITNLREKRAELSAEYAKLMVQFEPGYPAAKAIAQQIAALDSSIAREEGRTVGSRSTAYREAQAREANLRQQVQQLTQRVGQQQNDSIQYNIIQREVDSNRQLYDGLLQRYKEIGVASVGSDNISIVDLAAVPTRPSSPNLLLNLLVALVLGLALAAATAFALEQIDEGMRDPKDVHRLLGVPLLGSVSRVEDQDVLGALSDPKSPLSEAYLSIRSNIAFSTDHGVPRSLMVTSTRPAEGKSTTAFALAVMLGRTSTNVLLIDADMRSPSIHHMLNVGNDEGLSNILAGEDDWQRLVAPTSFRGVSVLTAGPTPPNAGELLSSDRMGILLQRLSDQFHVVVVDSPPILGLADAPLLARTVEGCVFIIEAEGVAIRGLRSSLGRLRASHGRIYGAVLTKLKQTHAGYGYGYGYGARYGDQQEVAGWS